MVTQQDILDKLDMLKTKDRPWLHPADYKQFLPNAIPNVPAKPDSTLLQARIQSIMDQSNTRTLTAQVKAQNRKDFAQLQQAQKAYARAQSNLGKAGSGHGLDGGPSKGSGSLASLFNTGPSKVNKGSLRGVGVGANLGHYNWHGRGLTLNRSVAPRFIGFLNALAKTGYRIDSLGSFANRNIAGTNTKSLHSYGLAIDINPARNPVTYGHVVTNLPRGVGRLAAKYGLAWGGAWNGPKFDSMHFSVPFGGRK